MTRGPSDREPSEPQDRSVTRAKSSALAQEDDDPRPWVEARDRRLNSYLVPDRPIPLAARSVARGAQ